MTTAPFLSVTVVLMLPLPVAAPHAVTTVPPAPGAVTVHDQLPNVVPTGALSLTTAPVTSPGPLLVTLIV